MVDLTSKYGSHGLMAKLGGWRTGMLGRSQTLTLRGGSQQHIFLLGLDEYRILPSHNTLPSGFDH